jgi:hypothetical protein
VRFFGTLSLRVVCQPAWLSTPEQKCIDLPEQKYINVAGNKSSKRRLFLRDQFWVGLFADMSELARRERRLL